MPVTNLKPVKPFTRCPGQGLISPVRRNHAVLLELQAAVKTERARADSLGAELLQAREKSSIECTDRMSETLEDTHTVKLPQHLSLTPQPHCRPSPNLTH